MQRVLQKNCSIRLVFNSFKIKNYFSHKDPIPNDLKSLLVYKFTCAIQTIQKNSVYPKTFYLNRFLVLTSLQNLYDHITRNRCRNRYTPNKKSYLHWRGTATYLYSQLTKLLLISRNMNYSRKNVIYLKQVYIFQSNQIKLKNPKSSLPLKRFIVRFLTTRETKSQIKAHLSYLANSYYYNYKPPRILRQHHVSQNLRENKDFVITKPDEGNGVVRLYIFLS